MHGSRVRVRRHKLPQWLLCVGWDMCVWRGAWTDGMRERGRSVRRLHGRWQGESLHKWGMCMRERERGVRRRSGVCRHGHERDV